MSLRALVLFCALSSPAQANDLTILVGGDLLEHGGVVEVLGVPHPRATSDPKTITLTERFARVQVRHDPDGKYAYRFRPVPDAMDRDGIQNFASEALTVGGREVEGPDGPISASFRRVRVLPFEEYGGQDSATRTNAAWGQTQGYGDPPPANHWGARAMPQAIDRLEDLSKIGLICADRETVPVCAPATEDALLLEALWWRNIAEGRLERMRHNALSACYDSGGLFGRPERCEGVPGRGWPEYVPD